jgi:hypothetical protein
VGTTRAQEMTRSAPAGRRRSSAPEIRRGSEPTRELGRGAMRAEGVGQGRGSGDGDGGGGGGGGKP